MTNIITVDFRKDTLFAVQRDDGVYVAVNPICRTLGINERRQRERIQEDQILREGCTVAVLPSVGGMQETFCLRLDLVNGWLFTIDESRVKDPEAREKVLLYKRECYGVLFNHFYGKATANSDSAVAILEPAGNEAHKLRHVAEVRLTFGHRAAQQLYMRLGLAIVPAMLEPDPQPELFGPDGDELEKKAA